MHGGEPSGTGVGIKVGIADRSLTRGGTGMPRVTKRASSTRSAEQEAPGHATIAVTLDLYSHVVPSLQREAAKEMGAALFG